MKSVIALRHVHFEDLGLLEPVLLQHGYDIRYVDACTADLNRLDVREPDLMVVLGGPIGAMDDEYYPFLRDEVALIRQRLASGKPLLGICLGAQLIARALGARVYSMGHKEIGFSEVHLTLAGGGSVLVGLVGVPVLHWHGDQFDVPEQGEWLAETDLGRHQAFSVGPNVLALQFHVEADCRQIERWLVGHANELGAEAISPCALRQEALMHRDRLREACARVGTAWLAQLR